MIGLLVDVPVPNLEQGSHLHAGDIAGIRQHQSHGSDILPGMDVASRIIRSMQLMKR